MKTIFPEVVRPTLIIGIGSTFRDQFQEILVRFLGLDLRAKAILIAKVN